MIKRILRLPAVKEMTGLSRSSLYAMMKDKSFPQAVALGARAVGWIESEILAWIEGKEVARKDIQ